MRAHQAKVLLACQQVRETRAQAERNHCARLAVEARSDFAEAERLVWDGAARDAEALQRSYDQLVGHSVDLSMLLAIREQEAEAARRDAERRDAAKKAAGTLDEAEASERAAVERSAEAARQLAKRERVVEVTDQEFRKAVALAENAVTDASGLASWLAQRA